MSLGSRIAMRITEQEKAELLDKAEEYKISMSQYIRLKLLSKSDIPIVRVNLDGYKLLGKTNFELQKIGININQLAHNANLSIQMGDRMDLQVERLNEIQEVVDQAKKDIQDIKLELKKLTQSSYDR
jgi:hypothetical protein